jgi:hypothetical protein
MSQDLWILLGSVVFTMVLMTPLWVVMGAYALKHLIEWRLRCTAPMPGQTWRFYSGDEVTITKVQSREVCTEVDSRTLMGTRYRSAFVAYRTQDGEWRRASFGEFMRSGRVVPAYEPMES